MARLALYLFGALEIVVDDTPVTDRLHRKARALLAYLAIEAGRPHRRDSLAALFWPDWPERSARTNLRNTLSDLRALVGDRKAIGDRGAHTGRGAPCLLVTRETIQFDRESDHWVDASVFDALVGAQDAEQAALEQAVALYRGPFLEGFTVESPSFEDWARGVRERLERQALDALQALTELHEARGEYDRARAYAQRRIELAPWQEHAHRDVMRLLALSGQRGSALAQYEACCRALREELDVEPGEETTRLYQRIRDGELGPPTAEKSAEATPTPAPAARPQPRAPPPRPPSREAVSGPAPAPLQGERRILTALLADVQGSTALAGQIDVELWVEIMDRVFQVLGAEIYGYGGEIDQYRGDGLVAFFGATAAHEDDPERAVRAALAMQAAVARYAAELLEGEGVELALRVGINTGEVIAASVGDSRQHREETAMGRAIALAARMETACEPGTVLVSEDTYRLAERLFEWETLGEIRVKGYAEPVAVYRPLATKAHPGKARGLPGLSSPLVGRAAEVKALQDALARLHAGIGGIVTVVGEAGIGKSRLVTEIRKSANLTSPNLRWTEGRCLSYATGVTYHLWLYMLRAWLDVAPDAPPAAVRETLRARVQALCPDRLDDVYPYLGRLLSLPLQEDVEARLRGLDGESLQFLTFRAVEAVLASAAARQPLVVVCEDLHWADPSSLALLQRLLPATERAPLLYVCVFRPLREHGCWQIKELAARDYAHCYTDLWLAPLTGDESAALVGNLLHVEDLPERLRARILDRAEGNPFFVEEILRSLIEGGMVVRDEATGHWQATQVVDEIPIPDTLHGVLSARIDRLAQETRHVLQQAAVLGRIFSYRVLAAVAGNGPPLRDRNGVPSSGAPEGGESLDAQLVALSRAQLIRERARLPEREYAFKHVLTQEAAYHGLLRRERRVLHRRAAEALERLYPERLEEQLGLLAHHWEQAGEAERAMDYLGRAGAQAAAHFANQEAVGYFSRALDLAPEGALAERYTLLLARERVLDLLGARDAQRQDLAALEALAETLADPARQAQVALRRAHLASRTQDYGAAAEAARDAIQRAKNARDVARQAAAHRELGRALRYQGDIDAAQRELEQALLLARAAGSRQVEVDALHELGTHWDDFAQEESLLIDQLRICREMENRRDEGRALRDLGYNSLARAKYMEAMTRFEESLQVCRETGNRRDEGWALHCLGVAYGELGDHATARAYGEQALRVHDETGDRLGKVWASLVLYRADVHTGDYAGARDRVGPVRELYERLAVLFLGDLALVQGDYRLARAEYEAGLRLNSPESGPTCRALCGLARIALAEGDVAGAQGYAEEILHGLEAWQVRWAGFFFGLNPYSVCCQVLHASGDPRAGEVLEEAYRLLCARADTIDDPALRRSYLENVAANREIAAAWQERGVFELT